MKQLLFLCLATALMLSGCKDQPANNSSSAEAPKALSTTLHINLGGEPATLDPSLIDDIPSNRVMLGLMEGLVWLDKNIHAQPGVAESWDHSPDYKTWTFHLRKDAKWQNGDPVVAGDFKFANERIMTPETNGNYAAIVYSIIAGGQDYYKAGGLSKGLHLDAIKVVDDQTLEYHLAYPAPFFLSLVAYAPFLPLNQKTVDQYGPKWSVSPDSFVGNGPFRMTEYHSRDRLVMTKADTYWGKDKIFWDKIVMLMIDSETTEEQAFRTGDIDVTESVPVAQMDYWMAQPEYQSVPALWQYYVGFNTQKAPFDNADVRKAFSKSIDRELIVKRIAKEGDVAKGIVPEGMPSADPDKTYREVAPDFIGPTDQAKAREFMKAAGYGADHPLPQVEYTYNTADLHKVIAEQMQNMWRQAFGIDVRLQNAEWGVTQANLSSGNYQFARMNWIADYADPLNFLEIFESNSTKNNPKFNNAKYDELVEKGRYEGDPVKRQDYFIQAEKILVEDECAIAPIFTPHMSHLVKTDLQGMEMNALGGMNYARARRVAK